MIPWAQKSLLLNGTTGRGGVNNFGTVFKLTPEGVETVLYSFAGTSDGATDGEEPVGQLIQGSDGNFYGVTSLGGRYAPSTTVEYKATHSENAAVVA